MKGNVNLGSEFSIILTVDGADFSADVAEVHILINDDAPQIKMSAHQVLSKSSINW